MDWLKAIVLSHCDLEIVLGDTKVRAASRTGYAWVRGAADVSL